MKMKYFIFILFVSLLIFSSGLPVSLSIMEQSPQFDFIDIVNQIDFTKVKDNVKILTSFGTRVTGYPGCDTAAQFIYDRFVEYGLQNVSYEYYNVTIPYDYGANITVLETGEIIKAYPLWPNLVETCAIPPAGIEGPLIYAGKGELSSYRDRINGSIVLMDFDSRDRWTYAARYGAKAVIFIEKETSNVDAWMKSLSLPLDFPRLYVKHEDGEHLLNLLKEGPKHVNVKSLMIYENRVGKNVIGYIYGSDPNLSNEIIIIAAHYDSSSIVPSLAPGAQEATGIATLLELARVFTQNPPKRTMMFVALSGHNQKLAGAREFVFKHFNDIGSKLKLFINLDLSTESDTVGTPFWGLYAQYVQSLGMYLDLRDAIFNRYLPKVQQQLKDISTLEDLLFSDQTSWYNRYILNYAFFYLDNEPFNLAGGLGFAFYTTHRLDFFRSTPFDTYEKIDFKKLLPQIKLILCLIYSIVNDENLVLPELHPISADPSKGGFVTLNGRVVEYDYETAWYKPVGNALVAISASLWRAGVTYTIIVKADENGSFTLHGAIHRQSKTGSRGAALYTVMAFVDSPTYGAVEYAPDMGKYGSAYNWVSFDLTRPVEYVNTVVFKSACIMVFDSIDPTRLGSSLLTPIIPEIRHYKLDYVPDSFGFIVAGRSAMVFVEPDQSVEILLRGIEADPVGWIANYAFASSEKGLKVQSGQTLVVNGFNTALDTYMLDEERLRLCESYGVEGIDVTELHMDAWKHIKAAMYAMEKPDYASFYKNYLEAWGLERQAYLGIKSLMKDVVYTTIFFFVFLIPFSFLTERLLIESKTIIKRLFFLTLIFGALTILLYSIHPSFHIASNVYMTILGFMLAILVSPGILLLLSRSIKSLKETRKALLGAHFVERSRTSMFLSSFSIGIGNLKKRKTRTLLTLISVIIVVFSLISFTSISSISIKKPKEIGRTPTYIGLYVRNPQLTQAIEQNLIDYLDTYGDIAVISKRAYYMPGLENPSNQLIFRANGESFKAMGIIGVSPKEPEVSQIDKTLINGTWFTGFMKYVCILPDKAANQLKVSVGDTVTFGGLNLMVIGIFDSDRYAGIHDLDAGIISPILPGAYETSAHIAPDGIVIVPYDLALMLGSPTYNVALRFSDESSVFEIAQRMARIFPGVLVYSGVKDKIFIFYKGEEVGLYGWQLMIVPFIIASLAILNIMLGAVYERTREIGIYSSLGLSPLNISAMFLAESVIYGIIGGLIGYILGNIGSIILRELQLLPREFIPNVSSSWVMLAVGLGMVSTLIATLYPMYKSARLVTPSLERKWKMPTKPKDGLWVIPLPFTPSKDEVDAVIAYIKEFFETYETSEMTGPFMVRNMRLVEKREDDRWIKSIRMIVRLAPYEAALEQETELAFTLEKDKSNCAVFLTLRHISGVMNVWKYTNKSFVDRIRKQLLLWTSLREADKKKYFSLKDVILKD